MGSETDRRDNLDADGGGDLLELYRHRERNLLLAVRTGAPATVVTYNPVDQTVICTVDFLAVESRVIPVDLPDPPTQLLRVPVEFPRSMAGLAYDSWPIVPGDTGRIACMDRAMDQWRRLGIPTDPIDGRTHSQADAVFVLGLHADVPGVNPTNGPIVPPPSIVARVIEAPLINLGALATQPVVRGTLLVAVLTTYATAMAAADSALNGAAQVYFALPAPTPPQQVTFQTAWAAWNTAVAAALATLITGLATTLSIKAFVE